MDDAKRTIEVTSWGSGFMKSLKGVAEGLGENGEGPKALSGDNGCSGLDGGGRGCDQRQKWAVGGASAGQVSSEKRSKQQPWGGRPRRTGFWRSLHPRTSGNSESRSWMGISHSLVWNPQLGFK